MKGKIDDQTLVLREHGIQVYIFHVCSKDLLLFFSGRVTHLEWKMNKADLQHMTRLVCYIVYIILWQ